MREEKLKEIIKFALEEVARLDLSGLGYFEQDEYIKKVTNTLVEGIKENSLEEVKKSIIKLLKN